MFFIIASLVMFFMAFFSAVVLFSRRFWYLKGAGLFLLMYLAFISRIAIRSHGYNELLKAMAWIGNIAIGVVSILFCAAVIKLAFDITGFLVTKTTDKFSPSRRVFLSRSLGAGLSFTVLPVAGYGVYRAVGNPVIKRVNVLKDNLHEGLKGFKIAQLTDIHVGPTVGAETVQNIVDKTNILTPDVVLITGDLVDGSSDFIGEYIAPLKDLKSTYGTYFVTGNHEYYSGAEKWIQMIEALGIKVLLNKNEIIEHNGAKLMVAGIPDIQAGSFGFEALDPAKAKMTDQSYDFSVIMSHRPEIADQIAEYGYDLQVSGHTHGGQFFPWTIAIHYFHKYVRGLYDLGGMQLYVSQGTAYWGPPLRIGAESEITLLSLS